MPFLTSAVLAAFVAYVAAWYLGFLQGDMSVFLLWASVVTGVYWVAEKLVFLPRRRRAAAQFEESRRQQEEALAAQGIASDTSHVQETRQRMLAQPKYAQQLKIGKARGGEAVILVENIRSYYDILQRNTPPLAPTPAAAEGLKKLVIEIEERRKAYARKMAAAKAIAAEAPAATDDEPLRLPTIETSEKN